MGIIIDIIAIAIFAVCIGIGYVKGLTGSLLKIVSFVLALVIAFVLFKPIANLVVAHTNLDESLEQSIKQMFIKENEEEKVTNDNKAEEQNQNMPTVIVNYINESVEKAGTEAKNAIVEQTARQVAITIINTAVLIALFIISRIVLLLVKGLAELLTKLPVIKQFDKAGGIIYGLVEAIVISYVILAIISFISPMLSQTGIIKEIQSSYLVSMLYNNNLLLKIIF